MEENKFVIITPCYNEEDYIESVIKSVVSQNHIPEKWIIVDDGSTDTTAELIKNYTDQYSWIEYLYNEKTAGETYYSSNVYAIIAGYSSLKDWEKGANKKPEFKKLFNYIAILDADIILCTDYYENIFTRFNTYPELGIATGTYLEKYDDKWIEAQIDRRSTPKAIQVFRRECYDKCGGYLPFKYGGEDSGIEIMARMHGWQTWSFNDIAVKHLRPVGTGNGQSLLKARFKTGYTENALGIHPVFMLLKCLKRSLSEKPLILSGIARFLGYLTAIILRKERHLPKKAMKYVRSEQINRMLNSIKLGRKVWSPND